MMLRPAKPNVQGGYFGREFANIIRRRLPRPLQTFVSLYGSWVAQLRSTPQHRTAWSQIRRLLTLLLVDVLVVATAVIMTSISLGRLVSLAGLYLRVEPGLEPELLEPSGSWSTLGLFAVS